MQDEKNIQKTLAGGRTYLALERTLMAWIRTALAMISFGFAIEQFFTTTERANPDVLGLDASGAQFVGLSLVTVGTLAMFAAILQHINLLKRVERETGNPRQYLSISLVVAIAIVIIGLGAMFYILSQSIFG